MSDDISKAAAALGKKGGQSKSEAKADASKANGAKGGRPPTWHKAQPRGGRNPLAGIYRYTVVRCRDKAERFTDRRPRTELVESNDYVVWDNGENYEIS